MVTLSNWFWPEEIRRNGKGMPMASTYETVYFGQWGLQIGGPLADLTLYSGQPVGAIVSDGQLSWRTNVAASGVSLFGLGGFPFRVQLPGGVAVVVSTGLRPETFRRGLSGVSASDFLQGDVALWLRVYVDDVLAGQSWQEWDCGDLTFGGDAWQLSAGWCGGDGSESVYAHLIPFTQGYLARPSYANDSTRCFGVGASIEVPLNGVFTGPSSIGITASSAFWNTGIPNLPVKWFTGHIVPLGNRLGYLPTEESPAAQLAASPGAVFAWADHPSSAAIGHLPWPLDPNEANGALEWDVNVKQEGPRHLGAIAQFRYSDHAVVPASPGDVSNVSATAAANDRLNRIRAQWSVNKSVLWSGLFAGTDASIFAPAGQFTFDTNAEGHGAWCEWSTKGFSETSQSVSYVSGATYSLTVEGASASVKLRRHSIVDPSSATEPGNCVRLAKWELSWQVWIKGRRTVVGSAVPGANTDAPFFTRLGSNQTVFLSDADAASLLAGQPINPGNAYTVGTFTFTAIGPP